ncbi:MAG TPA: hypothetical protein VGB56_11115 [Flavisolibacter sp.]|jgi:hypothetical protein
MFGKLKALLYPLDSTQNVVIWGNDPEVCRQVEVALKEAITGNGFADVNYVRGGIGQEDHEDFFYLDNPSIGTTLKIKFWVAASEDELGGMFGSFKVDLLLICLTFSSSEPHVHDESDKLDLGTPVRRSRLYRCRKFFLWVLNRTLFVDDELPSDERLDELTGFVLHGDPVFHRVPLSDKGRRQIDTVRCYVHSYYRAFWSFKGQVKALELVFRDQQGQIGNSSRICLSMYIALLNRNRFSNVILKKNLHAKLPFPKA